MDLNYSPDEQMLRDAVADYARDYLALRPASLALESGCDPAIWSTIAALGWLGVGFSEAVGGFGFGPMAEALVHEGVGSALLVEPVLAATLGARVLTLSPTSDRRDALLASIFAGETRLVLAHDEPALRGREGPVVAKAMLRDGCYAMSGVKGLVLGAPAADWLILTAQIDDGLGLFLIERATIDPVARICRTIDGGAASEFDLGGVTLPSDALIARGADAEHALDEAWDHAIMAGCAEAIGAMDAAIALTTDYLTTREQFGRRIGEFQALQHKVADMIVAVEQGRSALLFGLAGLTSGDGLARRRGASAARVRIIDSARLVGGHAVQLHGGIGVTDEHIISHYFRKLTAFTLSFGSQDHHLERYAAATAKMGDIV